VASLPSINEQLERIRKGREADRKRQKEEEADPANVLLRQIESRAAENERIRAERARKEAAAAELEARRIEQGAAPATAPSVAQEARARGAKDVEAGLAALRAAGEQRTIRSRNRMFPSVQRFTQAVGGGAPAARKGLFQGAQAAQARVAPGTPPAGPPAEAPPTSAPPAVPPQTFDPFGQPVAAPPPAPAAPGLPAGAVGVVPGQLPPGEVPGRAAPLEGEIVPGEGDVTFDFGEEEALAVTPEEVEPLPPEEPVGPESILQRQLDAEEALAQSRVDLAEAEAGALEEAAQARQEVLDEAEQAEQEAKDRIELQTAASEAATQRVEQASQAAIEAQAVDPRRAWANAGIGRKVGFLVQIAASSFGGGADPLSSLKRFIDQDIEAQREQAVKLSSDVDVARAAAGERSNMFQRTLQEVGDERVARDITTVARLNQVKAAFTSQLAAQGVAVQSAEQEAFLTGIEEEIAKKQLAIDQAAAQNPEFFTRTVAARSPGERRGLKLLGEGLIKGGLAAQEQATAQEGRVELRNLDAQIEQFAAQEQAATKANDRIAQQAFAFAKEVAPAKEGLAAIDDLLQRDDIPGIAFVASPTGELTPSGQELANAVDDIIEAFARDRTGAVIGPEEAKKFRERIMRGTTLGGEAALRRNLTSLRRFVNNKVETFERTLPRETREFVNKNVNLAEFEPEFTGGGDAPVVTED